MAHAVQQWMLVRVGRPGQNVGSRVVPDCEIVRTWYFRPRVQGMNTGTRDLEEASVELVNFLFLACASMLVLPSALVAFAQLFAGAA